MKILWISHLVPYPPKAGVLIRSHYLVKELSKHHDVDVIAFNQRGLIEPYFESYEAGTKKSMEVLSEFCENVKFFDCPVDKSSLHRYWCALSSLVSKHPYNMNWLKSEEFRAAVNDLHLENHYDLIHCDTISLAPYIDAVKNVTLSLDHHNVESHMLTRRAEQEKNLLKKFYFWQEGKRLEKIEKHYCPIFDINITCSDLDNDRFETFIDNAEFSCIPNGVDISVFKPSGKEPLKSRLIFIGTLDWYPNTKAVMYIAEKIWPLLKARVPDVTIDVVGARPPEKLIALSKEDANFRVHGFIDDLDQCLSDATAYVCPIDDGGGTKLKILDALSAGKAIIANPIACEGIQCEDGKNVLYATTPEQYVEHIENIFNNESFRKTLEVSARDLAVSKYAFESIGKKLSDEFERVHNSRLEKQ